MNIEMAHPLYLLLIPVIAGMLVFSIKYMYSHSMATKLGQIILRTVLATMLVLVLCQVTVKITGRNTTTIILVDASDSVKENRAEIVSFVQQAIKDAGKKDNVGIISFGGNTRVEQFISNTPIFNGINSDVSTQATNLEDAVNLALAQMPEDSAKRIVLITDGNENEGVLMDTASSVIASGATFEIKKIEENSSDEVYVSNVDIPENVDIGETFTITVDIESTIATPATVNLFFGRTLKDQQKVYLQKGTNTFIFRDTQTDEGLKTYNVTVEAENDTLTVNNEFSSYTSINIAKPLMLVEGSNGDADDLKGVLDSISVPYEVYSASNVPNTISTINQYSTVVLLDVYRDDLRPNFEDTLKSFVKDYGGGLVITGGNNSYSMGGYKDTVLEELSPVYMDLQGENEAPTMAFAMVIDKSGSMSSGNGIINNLDLAKSAAANAVDNLRPSDYIEVIAFDDRFERVHGLSEVGNGDDAKEDIYGISLGGGTSIYPGVEAATRDLIDSDAAIKHILLLTDGEDYNDQYDELIEVINDAGITLSTVGVGSGVNNTLLEKLANECGGRYFTTDIDTDLPRIFAQEVYLSANAYIVNEDFVPSVKYSDPILTGIEEMGTLHGYIATSPKERAIHVLQTQYGDPLLSYWQCGLGKVVAWTSDAKGKWSSDYSGQEYYQQLWFNINQICSEEMDMEGSYTNIIQNGAKATVQYFTDDFSADTEVKAIVSNDEGETFEVYLDPVKPGEYETVIETPLTGIYSINVQQWEGEDIVSSHNTAAIMQYSMEYRLYPDNTLLADYGRLVGAVDIDTPDQVFSTAAEHVKNRFNLSLLLLILAVLTFLFDIIVRRFNINLMPYIKKGPKKVKVSAKDRKIEKELASIGKGKTEAEPVIAPAVSNNASVNAGRQGVAEAEKKVSANAGISQGLKPQSGGSAGAGAGVKGAPVRTFTNTNGVPNAANPKAVTPGAAPAKAAARKAKSSNDDAPKATSLYGQMNINKSFENNAGRRNNAKSYNADGKFAAKDKDTKVWSRNE